MAMSLEQIEQKMLDNERFYQQRYEADQEALKAALAANDRRLEAMNEVRSTLADQATRLISRNEVNTMFAGAFERADLARDALGARLENDIKPLAARVEQIGRPNWPLMASFASVLAIMISALFLIIGLKIDASITPMALTVEQIKANGTGNDIQIHDLSEKVSHLSSDVNAEQQAVASIKAFQTGDNTHLAVLEDRMNVGQTERRAAEASTQGKLIEIETQFRAVSTVINLTKDDTHQLLGVLWAKAFPTVPLPQKNFRPALYNQNATP